MKSSTKVVNVASIPMRSPFRYPGGKTWLVPYIQRWFNSLPTKPSELIEPFAGGGIIGLTVAFEKLADHVTLVELDEQVVAVWQTILNDDVKWLTDKIVTFDLTPESVKTELSRIPLTTRDLAFQTILRNRVNRGGILAPGAGLIKSGEYGKGLASRWYPKTLKKRILEIVAIKDRITYLKRDGIEVLKQNAHRNNVVFFIDPPYTAGSKGAARRLYTHCEIDHEELFRMINILRGDFLVTYSDDLDIRNLVKQYGFEIRTVLMRNTHHTKITELLIGRNLDWVDNTI